ncbi:MAG: Tm-1-like ATP-binding domain-containing protein [Pirellula sp.]|jgi:uncharacterized protein (UPF0261 family)
MAGCVYLVATMDTKGEEIAFVRDCLLSAGVPTRMIDVGTKNPPTVKPDVTSSEVRATSVHNGSTVEVATYAQSDRGTAIAEMALALRDYLVAQCAAGRMSGVIGIGGSGGTSLITTAMRALPIGLPKIMVSTVASGNVAPYVDCSDILMLFSVVDIAGINSVSRVVLSNAAHAMAGMVRNVVATSPSKPTLGMTMFGVTTPCVNQVRLTLEQKGFDCLVFHATGSGGRAMELLVSSGLISGVLDITTTEVADEIAGGVFACGPDRFSRLIDAEIPLVLSLGALDMVNFGSRETVPSYYQNRMLHFHNPQVTLMRTNIEENRQIARFIATKLNKSRSPIRLLVPELGVSTLDQKGHPFYDPQADSMLFNELQNNLNVTVDRQLIRLPFHINSAEFAESLVSNFLSLWEKRKSAGTI